MSCWVVPTVAAELWGVSVDAILDRARSGQVPTRTENGFMFVDVAPDSTTCDAPRGIRPPTFTVVNETELAALHADEPPVHAVASGPDPTAAAPDDWRTGRRLASRSRKRPAEG
ncbi:hypothetical protein BH09PLA1_BH09PLA1_23260 [soil metagenome]